MQLRQLLPAIFCILATLPTLLSAATTPVPIRVSSNWEPFLDRHLIGSLKNVSDVRHAPKPREVCLTFDQPWEGRLSGNAVVIEDNGRFRVYYRGQDSVDSKPGLAVICYAESTNGIHWTRPQLNRFVGKQTDQYGGTRQLPPNNNIVWMGPTNRPGTVGSFFPFLDRNPDCQPDARYKALSRYTATAPTGEQTTRIHAFHSNDGIHWNLTSPEAVFQEPATEYPDILAFWDPVNRSYRTYHNSRRSGIQSLRTSTSPDFIQWTTSQSLTHNAAPAQSGHLPRIAPDLRAPHLFHAWQTEPTHATHISSTSRDGIEFTPTFLNSTRPDHQPAHGMLQTAPGEVSLYQVENDGDAPPRLRRLTVRPDGFASLQANAVPGECLTQPITFEGGELLLSGSASENGHIRIEVQDAEGTAIPGYTLSECGVVTGDERAHTVRWNGSPDLKPLSGRIVLLKFAFKEAQLHAIRFRDPNWRRSYPPSIRDATFTSSADGSFQPALFYHPHPGKPAPLLVALHSWSGDYYQTSQGVLAQFCVQTNWAFLHPNFRGRNNTPAACGSELAVSDIQDAVAWAQIQGPIDRSRVYLVGTSGGGHMALLMAGRAPELWTGVSAWVGISDLAAWHDECLQAGLRYANEIVQCCGGLPGLNPIIDAEYKARSPLTHLHNAFDANLPIDINAGINDGHTGSVPIRHSLRAFNVLASPGDRIADEVIRQMTAEAKVAPELQRLDVVDDSYGDKQPLFRRSSRNARVTIFNGGHEIVPTAALDWLSRLPPSP